MGVSAGEVRDEPADCVSACSGGAAAGLGLLLQIQTDTLGSDGNAWEQLKEIRWNKSGVATCVWLDPLAAGLTQEPGPWISPIGGSVMETEG